MDALTPAALAQQIRDRFAPLALGTFPTPVERLPATAPFDRPGEVWIKRDDRSAALYGGNKVRKLEFLLAAARARGVRRLFTVGGIGSHHVLATALYGRAHGFAVSAALYEQPRIEHTLAVLDAIRAAGVTFSIEPNKYALVPAMLRPRPGVYRIAAGGSSPLGALGFVLAGLELAEQVQRGELPEPARCYVAAGTCGTMAGLILGFRLGGLATRVIGVRVVDRIIVNRLAVRRLLVGTQRLLAAAGCPVALPATREIALLHDQFGGAYGLPTAAAQAAVEVARERAGVELETTYTGKAMAALLQDPAATGPTLFWNTFAGGR